MKNSRGLWVCVVHTDLNKCALQECETVLVKEIARNSTGLRFCVIHTGINVCCTCRGVLMKEIESEEQHKKGVVLCHTIHCY